jgi:hypothetical protein
MYKFQVFIAFARQFHDCNLTDSGIVFVATRAILLLHSQCWPKTVGSVISYEIATQTTYPPFFEIHGKMQTKWLKIKYSYNVFDKNYESKRISFGFTKIYVTDTDIEKDEFYKKIIQNKIEVYYLPFMPTISILKRQDDLNGQIVSHLVLILSYVSLIGLILFFVLH